MNNQINTEEVVFTIGQEMKLEDGTILAPGQYKGTSIRLRSDHGGAAILDEMKYFLHLHPTQVPGLTGAEVAQVATIKFSVTKYVRSGMVSVLRGARCI